MSSISNMSAMSSSMLSHASYAVAEDVDTLIDHQLNYSLRIERKKNLLEELNMAAKELKRDIDEQRKQSHKPYNDLCESQKRKRQLEHHLQTINSRLSQSRNEVANLKSQIDNLRSEKVAQKHKNKTLEIELEQKRKELKQLLLTTQTMHTKKEDNKRALENMKDSAVEGVADFTQVFENMKSATSFQESTATLFTVDNHGELKKAKSKQERRMEKLKGNSLFGDLGDDDQDEAARTKDDYAKSYWIIRERSNLLEKQAARIEEISALFSRIREGTGVSAEDIATTLEETENRAFQMFRMIHDYNQEQEALTEERSKLEREVLDLQGKENERQAHRYKIKTDLQTQKDTLTNQTRLFEFAAEKDAKELEDIMTLFVGIFAKLGCKDTAEGQSLHSMGISPNNLLDVLSVMEEQLDKMLQISHAKAHGFKPLKPVDLIPEGTTRFNGVSVKVPSMEDIDEIDEDEESWDHPEKAPKFQSTADLRKAISKKLSLRQRKTVHTPVNWSSNNTTSNNNMMSVL